MDVSVESSPPQEEAPSAEKEAAFRPSSGGVMQAEGRDDEAPARSGRPMPVEDEEPLRPPLRLEAIAEEPDPCRAATCWLFQNQSQVRAERPRGRGAGRRPSGSPRRAQPSPLRGGRPRRRSARPGRRPERAGPPSSVRLTRPSGTPATGAVKVHVDAEAELVQSQHPSRLLTSRMVRSLRREWGLARRPGADGLSTVKRTPTCSTSTSTAPSRRSRRSACSSKTGPTTGSPWPWPTWRRPSAKADR